MRSFIVKENHIGPAVSEILRYRQKKLTTLYSRIAQFVVVEAGGWLVSS